MPPLTKKEVNDGHELGRLELLGTIHFLLWTTLLRQRSALLPRIAVLSLSLRRAVVLVCHEPTVVQFHRLPTFHKHAYTGFIPILTLTQPEKTFHLY